MTATVIRGDARTLPLADASVDLIVTSPPYWALRSYTDGGEHYAGQIGAEPTPAAYVDSLIECTREWVRVLKPSGSLWVNLGDKYAADARGPNGESSGLTNGAQHRPGERSGVAGTRPRGSAAAGVPKKSLIGLPWRYALRCVDDLGLILRAEVIWSKPNGLPESVTDRVRRSHEQWFHFTKEPRYFAAVDAIRETYSPGTAARYAVGYSQATSSSSGQTKNGVLRADGGGPSATNRRIIKGWSPSGICTACGEGRRPVAAGVGLDMTRPQARRAHELATGAGLTEAHFAALLAVGVSDTGRGAATQSGTGRNTDQVYALAGEARAVLGGYAREYLLRRPTSFREACACPDVTAPTRPAVVLDPFGGAGTTALVAHALGRHGISVDMSADYGRLARWRTSDPGQRAAALEVPKPPAESAGQLDLFASVSTLGGEA